jgi:hypothetical protein
MPSSSDPSERLRTHFRKERSAMHRHPLPEQITAYHERRLSPDEMEEMRAHLAACPDCTAELLDLVDLVEGGGPAGSAISRTDLDAAWQRHKPHLASLPAHRDEGGGSPIHRPWPTVALGLAAALLAVIALAQWRTIAHLRQPQVNPPLINLVPVGSLRQGDEVVPELRPSAKERVWVILNPSIELDPAAIYAVEVVGPAGEAVLRFEDLQPSEAANFRLEIPRALLSPGSYQILLERGAGEGRLVQTFALDVRPGTPAAP